MWREKTLMSLCPKVVTSSLEKMANMVFTLKICYVKRSFGFKIDLTILPTTGFSLKGGSSAELCLPNEASKVCFSYHSFEHTIMVLRLRLLFREENLIDPRVFTNNSLKPGPSRTCHKLRWSAVKWKFVIDLLSTSMQDWAQVRQFWLSLNFDRQEPVLWVPTYSRAPLLNEM